jgi:hypothetical protein
METQVAKRSALAWPIGALLDGLGWRLVGQGIIQEWFWEPCAGVWKIWKGIEISGLFACMTWAMRGSEVRLITVCQSVRWEPDHSTEELYLHGWPVHRSDYRYWPWGWSGGQSKPDLINLLDAVALNCDLPQDNLWRGQVGTVVEILADGTAFEIEFSDRNGRVYASLGLRPEQIMVLYFEEVE